MGTSIVADASYTAFGGDISASWRIDEYRFQWVGGWGYRKSEIDWVNTYVRARHYSAMDGAWTTVDPLWPDERAYQYVEGRVMTSIDVSGQKKFSISDLIGPQRELPGFITAPRFGGGKKVNKCILRVCNVYGNRYSGCNLIDEHTVTHQYVVVMTSSGKRMKAGLYDTGIEPEDHYPYKSGRGTDASQSDVECHDISTNCTYAALAAECIRAMKKSPPPYNIGIPFTVCWTLDSLIVKCACDRISRLYGAPAYVECKQDLKTYLHSVIPTPGAWLD